MDKKLLRSQLFKHLDGIVTIPILAALAQKGVLNTLKVGHNYNLSQLSDQFQANEGYLNVALRALASQGFLDYTVDGSTVTIAPLSSWQYVIQYSAITIPFLHQMADSQHYHQRFFDDKALEAYLPLLENYYNNFDFPIADSEDEKQFQDQFKTLLEGCLAGPSIVKLGMSGMFHKYFMESSFKADEFHKNATGIAQILDFFTHLGWFTKKNENYQFTDIGLFYARRAASYGVTVSYIPLLSKMEDLLFGDAAQLKVNDGGSNEIHVDRAMNVWGSGGAHAIYFKVIDDFIIDIFNQPLHLQPKGILDLGCGNGALLQHLFETIEHRTLRGKHLEDYPLFLVGVDYNQAALKITRANLIANDIWAKVIWGDIGNPVRLAEDLRENYNIALGDLLNMRTFLDHNRIWEMPQQTENLPSALSTGAYAHNGIRLNNQWVEQSLVEHLQKWHPFIEKYGLLLIELHTLNPKLTAQNLGKTAATAYDATHGFSDQYILEVDVFEAMVERAGMTIDQQLLKRFPENELATVSIHLLK